jgi:hypothetical protein
MKKSVFVSIKSISDGIYALMDKEHCDFVKRVDRFMEDNFIARDDYFLHGMEENYFHDENKIYALPTQIEFSSQESANLFILAFGDMYYIDDELPEYLFAPKKKIRENSYYDFRKKFGF